MVAESGHVIVKNESDDDFRKGADFESAEMMLGFVQPRIQAGTAVSTDQCEKPFRQAMKIQRRVKSLRLLCDGRHRRRQMK